MRRLDLHAGARASHPSPRDAVRRVTVVVPARNEELLIGRCLDGLDRARRRLRRHRPGRRRRGDRRARRVHRRHGRHRGASRRRDGAGRRRRARRRGPTGRHTARPRTARQRPGGRAARRRRRPLGHQHRCRQLRALLVAASTSWPWPRPATTSSSGSWSPTRPSWPLTCSPAGAGGTVSSTATHMCTAPTSPSGCRPTWRLAASSPCPSTRTSASSTGCAPGAPGSLPRRACGCHLGPHHRTRSPGFRGLPRRARARRTRRRRQLSAIGYPRTCGADRRPSHPPDHHHPEGPR